MALLPQYIPLPHVTEYSDTISVGELGLPVGFDTERLLMHVSAVEKIARLGDIGALSIVGYRGDTTEVSYSPSGLSSDGTGTASRSVAITKAQLHDLHIDGDDELPDHYKWKSATVRINNAEIDTRIRNDGDKWEMGPFDVKARAKYMNKALQSGLAEATQQAVLLDDAFGRVLGSATKKYVSVIFWSWAWQMDIQSAFVLDTVIDAGAAPINHFIQSRGSKRDGKELPPRQWSMFNRVHYDRLLATQGLTRTTQLIRAKKGS